MSIPAGAQKELKDIHKLKPFYKYLKLHNGIYYSCDGDGDNWKRDDSMRNMLEFYTDIESTVETPEEKVCLDAIANKIECNYTE